MVIGSAGGYSCEIEMKGWRGLWSYLMELDWLGLALFVLGAGAAVLRVAMGWDGANSAKRWMLGRAGLGYMGQVISCRVASRFYRGFGTE